MLGIVSASIVDIATLKMYSLLFDDDYSQVEGWGLDEKMSRGSYRVNAMVPWYPKVAVQSMVFTKYLERIIPSHCHRPRFAYLEISNYQRDAAGLLHSTKRIGCDD